MSVFEHVLCKGLPRSGCGRSLLCPAVLAGGWVLCIVFYTCLAFWLAAHPASLSSDDALFFARGLIRYSILDFSPHFPGYPGFVALGRFFLGFMHAPTAALSALALAAGLALPPATALLAWRIDNAPHIPLIAFAIAVTSPLLPALCLNLLSDGTGLLFFLAALCLLPRKELAKSNGISYLLSGSLFGLSACCRPSNAVMLASAYATLCRQGPRCRILLPFGACLVLGPAFAVVYALEGVPCVWAGLNFIRGHVRGWGNTIFAVHASSTDWLDTIADLPGGSVIAILVIAAFLAIMFQHGRVMMPTILGGAFAGHSLWVFLMQNHQNTRHLAPLILLGELMIVLAPVRTGAKAVLIAAGLATNVYALVGGAVYDPALTAPLDRAAQMLQDRPVSTAIVTNEGVELLREHLPRHHIYDLAKPGAVLLDLLKTGNEAYRVSTTDPGFGPRTVFKGRVPGEKTVYVYRMCHASKQSN